MNQRRIHPLALVLVVAVPAAAAAGWWFYLPHYQWNRARAAAAAGDWQRAAGLLRPITLEEPASYEPYFLYAQALRHLRQPAQAQAELLLAVRRGLPEAEGRREFALAEVLKGFTPKAEENLRRVLQERRDHIGGLTPPALEYHHTL